MRVMKVLLLLAFASVAFGQSIQERVGKFEDAKSYSVTYDKFKQATEVETTVQVKGRKGTRNMEVFLSFTSDPLERNFYLLSFVAGRHSYFNQPTLRLLIDDVPYKYENDRISEIASFIINKDLWKAVASAKSIELQFETFEGTLDAKNLKKFQSLATLIP